MDDAAAAVDAAASGPPEAWQVVFKGRVVVRSGPSTDTEALRAKISGSILLGHEQGGWLKLFGEPGFMLIDASDCPLLCKADEEATIHLQYMSGDHVLSLVVPCAARISALRSRIRDLHGIPIHLQELLVNDRILEDEEQIGALESRELLLVKMPHDPQRGPELYTGAQQGDQEKLDQALSNRAPPDYENPSDGFTALVMACFRNDLQMVHSLYEAGADLDKASSAGFTPLLVAAGRGFAHVTRFLIEQGASKDSLTSDKLESPLALAASSGHAEIITYLCAVGASCNLEANSGPTALMMAAQHGHVNAAESLCKCGALVDQQSADPGATALDYACDNGHVEVLRYLVGAGAQTNRVRRDGITALFGACFQGHAEVARCLLEAKADIEMQKEDNVTPLMAATQNGHAEIVRILCEFGVETNRSKRDGAHALLLASHHGHQDAVATLCEARANVDQPQHDGATPIIVSAASGHNACAEILLKTGANVNSAMLGGETALLGASVNGQAETAQLLIEWRANVDKAMYTSKATPLHKATENGHLELAKILCEAGADRNAVMKPTPMDFVWTPMDFARKSGREELIRYLEHLDEGT